MRNLERNAYEPQCLREHGKIGHTMGESTMMQDGGERKIRHECSGNFPTRCGNSAEKEMEPYKKIT